MMKITTTFLFALAIQYSYAQTSISFQQVTPVFPDPSNMAEFDDLADGTLVFSDVDGDSDQDVLVSGANANYDLVVKLFVNDGLGNFTWNQDVNFGTGFISNADFSDIDGDGDNDLITIGITSDYAPETNLYLNDGFGNFTIIEDSFIDLYPGLFDGAVVLFDSDNDTDVDVIIAGEDEYGDHLVNLYINDGNGSYTLSIGNDFDGGYGAISISDIDGDIDLDVLMIDIATINLYLNDGAGNYTFVSSPFGEADDGTISFGDMDGDGDNDVVITGHTTDAGSDIYIASLYSNDGLGNFNLVPGTPFIPVRMGSTAIFDIDGDDDNDILIVGKDAAGNGTTHLYKNEGANSFIPVTISFEGLVNGDAVFSDVDNDEDLDLLMTGFGIGLFPRTHFYLNDGAGNFALIKSSPFMGVNNARTFFSDVDGDSDKDVLIMGIDNSHVGQARLYINDGNGNYAMTVTPPFEGLNIGTMGIADVDGDNDNDVLVTGHSFPANPVARLYLNDGTGNFTLFDNTTFTPLTEGTIDFGDIDADGDFDVLMTGSGDPSPETNIYKNDGSGHYTLSASLMGVWRSSVALSDMDNDSDLDLIITGQGGGRFYTNDGTGNFVWEEFVGIFELVNGSIGVSDLDNDGDNDLLLTGEPVGSWSQFMINNGDLTFTSPTNTPVEGLRKSALGFIDIEGDGDDDLVITGFNISDVPVTKLYTNDGTGQFSFFEDTPFEAIFNSGVAFADIDNDGDQDFLMAGLKDTNWAIAKLYRNNSVFNPFFTVNTFIIPSDINNCTGAISISAFGNPNFNFNIDNGSILLTSAGYALVDSLCPGIHNLLTVDNIGDNLTSTFVIPVDSNYVFNNPFIDSLAQDSLGTTLENCEIYYNSIDTAYIDSIWATGNTVNVVWNIVDSNGSNFDTTSYVLNNGNGVYWLQLSVFCPTKALGDYFTVTEAIYFADGDVSTAGINELEELAVTLYPNPTNDVVRIDFDGHRGQLTVYDLHGKFIRTSDLISGDQVSLKEMENGVYLFVLETDRGKAIKRVIKQ